MGFPIMRHVRVVKAATRANQDDRQTLVLVYVEMEKRRRTSTHFADNPVAITRGWQPVNGAFNAAVEGGSLARRKGRSLVMLAAVV